MDPLARLRRPTPDERRRAVAAVTAELPPSPLWPTEWPDAANRAAWLKLESAQPTGAFKVRGALAALATLPPGVRAVSASAGNHALGMAWASGRLGVPVTVVTATTASEAKVSAIRALAARPGAQVELVQHGDSYEEAEAHARGLAAAAEDGVYVSAYSDWAVIAGASSVGAELDARWPPPTPLTVACCLGGGGLTSGLVLWALERPAPTRIVAAEAAASPGAGRSATAGAVVEVEVGATVADGLAGNLEAGSPTPAILREGLTAGVLEIADVGEEELGAAMRWLFARHGLVAEGAGAAATAAALRGGTVPDVALVTGRNVTAATYARILTAAPR